VIRQWAQPVNHVDVPLVSIARAKERGTYFPPVVDNRVQFEAAEPAGAAFLPPRIEFERFMAVNTPVMACFQNSGVYKTYAGTPPAPQSLRIQEQRQQRVAVSSTNRLQLTGSGK
jgi:hypothetical protein